MGGGSPEPKLPKGGSGKTKWYVVCCKGKTGVTKEENIGDCTPLTQAFESKKEAIKNMNELYPDGKC